MGACTESQESGCPILQVKYLWIDCMWGVGDMDRLLAWTNENQREDRACIE